MVERFFIGLAIVSLVSLLVTRGTSASRWAVTSSRKKEHKMPVATEVLAVNRGAKGAGHLEQIPVDFTHSLHG